MARGIQMINGTE